MSYTKHPQEVAWILDKFYRAEEQCHKHAKMVRSTISLNLFAFAFYTVPKSNHVKFRNLHYPNCCRWSWRGNCSIPSASWLLFIKQAFLLKYLLGADQNIDRGYSTALSLARTHGHTAVTDIIFSAPSKKITLFQVLNPNFK